MKVVSRGKKGLLSTRIRVPRRYADIEKRNVVWISLGTDSRLEAQKKLPLLRDQLIASWEAKLAGQSESAAERYEAARQLAESTGLRFMPASDVARLPVGEIVARTKMIGGTEEAPDIVAARAFLGGAEKPMLTVSEARELYFALTKDKTNGMSADQKRIWTNPRKKAVANFVEQIGDLPLDQITRDHMLDFRKWWSDRVSDGEVSTNSANKEIGHLSSILSAVNELKRLGLNLPLGGLALKETDQKNRPPFSDAWIKDKLLGPGALDGLNIEARNILRVMINTGGRPSEVAALLPTHIHLSAKVPFIEILPDGRHVKSVYSKRKIPLVGVSLTAMRECKDGFSRYRNKPGLSATINKFLFENGLKESPDHVLYSLRHSFEDRMLAAGIDERIRRDLLGHRLNRERYGAGASLEHVHQLLQAIAL